MSQHDEEFDAILQEALRQAAGVNCDAAEYRKALAAWIDEIVAAIRASEEMSGGELEGQFDW